ncbi:MAG: thiamine-phosphate kinase [Alphaproteobacteria bacterium]|nr:thiamine-phosphate kinase [Alphaproteobacteria bacterium]
MSGEFDLIAEYFLPLAGPEGLGFLDDAACFSSPEGQDIVVTKDLLVEGIHFVGDEAPASIAMKCLAVNLSDLAAKGAKPALYWLGISVPKDKPGDWVGHFASGLKAMQERSGIALAGGDTTASLGGITVSITALGYVPKGGMLRRTTARAGDDIYVTGTLGDAALGLRVVQGALASDAYLAERYRTPTPRNSFGEAIRTIATACADISDGLLADVGHIAIGSGVCVRIEEKLLPISDHAADAVRQSPALRHLIYSGGDDYELVFTAPKPMAGKISSLANAHDVAVTCVGRVEEGEGVRLVDPDGKLVQAAKRGFDHFSNT